MSKDKYAVDATSKIKTKSATFANQEKEAVDQAEKDKNRDCAASGQNQ